MTTPDPVTQDGETMFRNPWATRYYQQMQGREQARQYYQSQNPTPEPTTPVNPNRFSRALTWTDTHTPNRLRQVSTPRGVPRFLGNRNVLFATWIVAMIIASADEIKTNNWAPRPARLWWISLSYGLLLLLSEIDGFVPLVNALAIGLDVALLYEFWSGNNTPAPTGNTASSSSGTTTGGSGTTPQASGTQSQTVAPGVVIQQRPGPLANPITSRL